MPQHDMLDGKLMTVDEAVERFVHDGGQVCVGGFTINRNPMAVVYGIARRRVKDLHLVAHSNGQALDVLVGTGCVRRLDIAYGGNGRFASTCFRFRKAVERGEVQIEDYTNNQMSLRFLAGALNVPFIPSKSGLGTDVVERSGLPPEARGDGVPREKVVVLGDPFDDGDDQVVLLPALTPDVSIIHAQQVGTGGTVRIKGLTFADLEQCKAATAVIVSCEEIVPEEYLRIDPDQNALPPFLVDAVVPVPYGAHPTACRYFYDYDPVHLNHYKAVARDDEQFAAWLDEWVYGIESWDHYLDKVGGARLARIRANTVDGYAPGLDRR
ncbi:MAG: CoA transferase subunit A [Actinobacteria bacterium]|nr:CoA transferase subunit A [Actinomycetota bacterium]